ncbi:hypothetical protein MSMTP_2327 [Methanosarcina sp. MTP4]|uniref:hypothetical protein n=1 Tax=Methanosarcina sp. MTP4 TaxID=1434100 RepID=UPI000615876E|nr:hypothetical protein [Methanosarcina sp. MTP4]AKB25796.1 hypothetical protein MSMTP_2327 [Methanosarcina sp. MTP4]
MDEEDKCPICGKGIRVNEELIKEESDEIKVYLQEYSCGHKRKLDQICCPDPGIIVSTYSRSDNFKVGSKLRTLRLKSGYGKKALEQLERARRWYLLFEEISIGTNEKYEFEYSKDVMYAFFMNCFHVKDWLIEDDSIPKINSEYVGKYIKNDQCLQVCGSIANGAKHLNLRETQGTNKNYEIFRSDSIHIDSTAIINSKFTFSRKEKESCEQGRTKYEAFKLATECLESWEIFFEKNDIIYIES